MARWRLAAHLQKQDWAAVVIDLAIVVVGVFLGIQASNWNDERKDRRVAHTYLQRIKADLGYDLSQLRQRENYWKITADAGDRALRFAEEGKVDHDQWTTLLDFFTAGQIWNFAPSNGTYGEMLSAGRLDLLEDRKLKSDLSAYYIGRATQARALFDILPPYRDDIRGAVPYRFQRYILERCEGNVSTGYRGEHCAPPPDTSGLAELNRRLATNSGLVGHLRNWMTTLRYTRGAGIDDQHYALRLIHTIDGQAGSVAD